MKFSEMPYKRPDTEALKQQWTALTQRLEHAATYEEARAAFLEQQALSRSAETQATLASVRHSIDTRDAFYDGEEKFWNVFAPELEEYEQAWKAAMLASPFRKDFAAEYGELMFLNAEIDRKSFAPEIIPEMQQENDLVQAYEKLIASAQIPFEGKTYTLSQLQPMKTDPDDDRRLAAWKADSRWSMEHAEELDTLYDKLVHLRDAMGRKLGYDGYTTLGYYRMKRNCYTKDDVEKFRAAVRKYLVPVAEKIYRKQAERLGKSYPMSFADAALEFRSGNPRPVGTPDDILAQGMKFYSELSPETKEFFETMLRDELLERRKIGLMRDGAGQIAVIVEDGQPHSHGVVGRNQKIGVDAGLAQPVAQRLGMRGVVDRADKAAGHSQRAEIFRDIARHAAVGKLNRADVGARGRVRPEWVALDVQKNRADNGCADHKMRLFHD